jgi:hypothetical protein
MRRLSPRARERRERVIGAEDVTRQVDEIEDVGGPGRRKIGAAARP